MLQDVAPLTAQHFARALVMPNTRAPITTAGAVVRYRDEILAAAPGLCPLMTIKLMASTTEETVWAARSAGAIAGKLYPQGVTTNSQDGVSDPLSLMHVYAAMERCEMVLCLHGETPGEFCLTREVAFLETLQTIAGAFPNLKIVLEHVTTQVACWAVRDLGPNVAATITVHHLVLTLDDVIGDNLRPHHFCKPVPKTPQDRDALRDWATSGDPKFFLGTDSAPHAVTAKECAEGCAGVFTAPIAMALLAEVFEQENALDRLEAFTSEFGARFYGLEANEGTLDLVREPWTVPPIFGQVIPLWAGRELSWRVL